MVKGGMTVTEDAYLQTAVSTYSDNRLKDNITDIPHGALAKILTLRGVYYSWKSRRDLVGVEPSTEVGIIAQDVAMVLPEAVHIAHPCNICPDSSTCCDEAGHMYVAYDMMIPLLLKAVQELDQLVTELDVIDSLSSDLNNGEHITMGKRFGLNGNDSTDESFNIGDYESRLTDLSNVNEDIERRIRSLKESIKPA